VGRWAFVVALAVAPAACGGDEDATPAPDADATTTSSIQDDAILRILVSNDDGVEGEGIAVLVDALATLDNTEVVIVAPLEDRTGTGGNTTEGPLEVTDVELVDGTPARAVDGFPADSIRVAIDELEIDPHVVVTGINAGQNLGPLLDVSGTVGAARAAVERGVPALATSQGLGASSFDYDAATPLVLDWITEHRAALVARRAEVSVTNLNVPSCDTGDVRGLAEVDPDLDGDVGAAVAPQDCTSTAPLDPAAEDVAAFVIGYATITPIPSTPGTG
jgi:5'-nucleotidase